MQLKVFWNMVRHGTLFATLASPYRKVTAEICSPSTPRKVFCSCPFMVGIYKLVASPNAGVGEALLLLV
jgi:hypothetical protein